MALSLFHGLTNPEQVPSPYRLERVQVIPQPLTRVFDFFADAGNLETITPPWLNFHIITPKPIAMDQGALIDYQIRWGPVPLAWRTEIREWQPPHRFVDVQLRGPYRLWHHLHEFESVIINDTQMTRMLDVVHYALPITGLSWLAHSAIVKRDLNRIFDYRYQQIERIFGPSPIVAENLQNSRTSSLSYA
jgi:ligand-binding SRPBCC domain-containing protein